MAYSKQLTATIDDALRRDLSFLAFEVKTGGIRDSSIKKSVERCNTLESYLISRDISEEPSMYSGLIGFEKNHYVSYLNLPEIDELDYIIGTNRFDASSLCSILNNIKKEKKHSELYSVLTPEVISPVKKRPWYPRRLSKKGHRRVSLNSILNQETNGIIPEEYFAQMLGEVIPDSLIYPRVNINGSLNIPNSYGNLEFILDEEEQSKNECDLIVIAEEDSIISGIEQLFSRPYNCRDLKSKLISKRNNKLYEN